MLSKLKEREQVNGAKDGIRTRDPDLGKVVLYQLSYFRFFKIGMQIYDNQNQLDK